MDEFAPTRVFCEPGVPWKSLLQTDAAGLPEPLGRKGIRFFLRGGTALWQGIRLLRLPPGGSVLFPAYHCGVELDVLRQAGLDIVFYGIDRRLRIDPGELRRLAGPRTSALYIIHYFGFPQPVESLRRLCASRGWHLIEDCAQALFTRCNSVPAGTTGDIGIFSIHKFLPLPCCGALFAGRAAGPPPAVATKKPLPGFVARQTIDLLGRDVVRLGIMNASPGLRFRKAASGWIRAATTDTHEKQALQCATGPRTFVHQWRDSAPPRMSRQLLARLPAGDVAPRRRKNFNKLLQSAREGRRLRPLLEALPEGSCPLYFPVVIPNDADRFVAFCHRGGVAAQFLWRGAHPAFPRERFREAAWLRDHIVVMPVHQGLKKKDLDCMATLMHDWERAR
jgi:dTDP-4-amino-4,6-dideoxygalactose transaminase